MQRSNMMEAISDYQLHVEHASAFPHLPSTQTSPALHEQKNLQIVGHLQSLVKYVN